MQDIMVMLTITINKFIRLNVENQWDLNPQHSRTTTLSIREKL